jgi:hypothetical protein
MNNGFERRARVHGYFEKPLVVLDHPRARRHLVGIKVSVRARRK